MLPHSPKKVIHKIIERNNSFPNNSVLPLLIYQQVFNFDKESPEDIQHFLKENHWKKSWVDSIYDYHHYHSNTHEVLVIHSGTGRIQVGGDNGEVFDIESGDVVIFPAGVSHKSLQLSKDFKCVGAYPLSVDYDMKYGKDDEYENAVANIRKVPVPKTDPVFGEGGLLFRYW